MLRYMPLNVSAVAAACRSWKDRKGEVCLRIESGASQRTGDRWDSECC